MVLNVFFTKYENKNKFIEKINCILQTTLSVLKRIFFVTILTSVDPTFNDLLNIMTLYITLSFWHKR